ncbi:hypothetical protein SBOR_5208 [Sclerotinia borealis F-4128]|uniref:Uncharacterized protein n=1 Tax=Sclerotinia borealis (strain F-4128) TaxID=1432307 RepID=W9CIR8_SCLBF|nr:hypothetical protein SBOR_5208 [Sclerotinia borealis F-4128]
MSISTTALFLAILCLTKLSLSRPTPKPEKGNPLDVNLQIPAGPDVGVNVGNGDNIVHVDVNTLHLPLIPCMNILKSLKTSGATLPLTGRSLDIKRVGPALLSRSVSERSFVPISTTSVNAVATTLSDSIGPMIAIDSSIPNWSSSGISTTIDTFSSSNSPTTAKDLSISRSSSARRFTLEDASTTSKKARLTHTHYRASLSPNPPSTIIIEPLSTSTSPKMKHTSRLFKGTHIYTVFICTSASLTPSSPNPKSINYDSQTFKPTFTWISPPQTRSTVTPIGLPVQSSTTWGTKMLANTSRKVATWHPPAETLCPSIIERGAPNKG